MLLALDTATRQAGLALYTGDEVRAEMVWQAGRHHTEVMAPAIQALLARAGAHAGDLTALAVSLGPGSFTGLRIGLALAKGLAAANNLPIVGVPTLDVTAYPHLIGSNPVCALLQMGRGRLAYSFYAPDAWRSDGPYLGVLADVIAAVQMPTRFVGELLPAERQALRVELGLLAVLNPPSLAMRRPGHLAEIAWERILRGETDDLHTLAPIYAEASVRTGPTDA
ncbi:MAG: tRNA (adenosine(37)-N6)-threonylcarbamoyltransferase complex dimerization subunit type 1 TsaB [Ardenticatenaceae bacterium]|nr:tRNA (adenosine(37)-N6)-threonylcarbamoyltransferase complex dimerization subunit type 1 TsaB [Ardenticatenaceae bacterium]HBY99574.1 tRNA (adenosine(37)-N6)-threonylcarbamoyltransferase complex dimerization subunit type 1 TsaB [Chloroflexota bacterium]